MKKYLVILMMAVALTFGCATAPMQLSKNVQVVQYSPISVQIIINKVDYDLFEQTFNALNYAVKEGIDTVNIYVISPGGGVVEMFAIYDMLMEFKAKGLKINTHGYGIVGSAAVPIFLVGDVRTLNTMGYFMLHPHSGEVNPFYKGNINETLQEWTELYAKILVDRTKMKYEDAIKYLTGNPEIQAEYINSKRALELGLITSIR